MSSSLSSCLQYRVLLYRVITGPVMVDGCYLKFCPMFYKTQYRDIWERIIMNSQCIFLALEI